MTRKEWVKQNYPNNIDENYIAGVLACPYKYPELCRLDPKVKETMICPGINFRAGLKHSDCDACWNTSLPEKKADLSDCKPEIRKTLSEPHIKDVFYTIVRYPIGKYWLYTVGEFSITSMSMVNDSRVKCVAFDYDLQFEYMFFYDIIDKMVELNYDVQYQAKKTPNLDRSLFLERQDAVEALEKWTGNVFDRRSYVFVKKGEQK